MQEVRPLKRAVIKEEFVALTGDHISALILNQFIYWLKKLQDFDKFLKEENERAMSEGKEVYRNESLEQSLKHGWIYKSAKQLKEELMLEVSEDTVGRRLKKLVNKGYIERRKNPIYKWDRTWQYRPNMVKIANDLKKLGYVLQGFDLSTLHFPKTHDADSILQVESLKMHDEGINVQGEEYKNIDTNTEIKYRDYTGSDTIARSYNNTSEPPPTKTHTSAYDVTNFELPNDKPKEKPATKPNGSSPTGRVEKGEEEVFLKLPLVTGEDYPVTKREVEEHKELFPGVDVEQQLRNMRAWLLANPKRRKTPRGIRRFIVQWLMREQDRGSSVRYRGGGGEPKGEQVRQPPRPHDGSRFENIPVLVIHNNRPSEEDEDGFPEDRDDFPEDRDEY